MTWMRLPEEYRRDGSKFCVLSLPFEGKVTYGRGASMGPQAIVEASEHLEYYDERFGQEPFVEGILPVVLDLPDDEEAMIRTVKDQFPKNEFVVGLGGDHSVTLGMLEGYEVRNGDFDVIVLDAHSDLRDSWNDSPLNHACVSRQASKKHDVLLVGVRSQDGDEAERKPENVRVIKKYEFAQDSFREALKDLKKRVYVSIDVDVFDPSFIRNTGTPEPGGFLWDDVVEMLATIFEEKAVIGADIVEFAPQEQYAAEAYSLAKLAYTLMALKVVG